MFWVIENWRGKMWNTTAVRAGFSSHLILFGLLSTALRCAAGMASSISCTYSTRLLSDLQSERRGPAREAPVAPADGAGGKKRLHSKQVIALEMGAALDIAPIDHQRVAQPRPARKIDGLARRPVEPQLALKAHRAGRALVGLADVMSVSPR